MRQVQPIVETRGLDLSDRATVEAVADVAVQMSQVWNALAELLIEHLDGLDGDPDEEPDDDDRCRAEDDNLAGAADGAPGDPEDSEHHANGWSEWEPSTQASRQVGAHPSESRR